MTRPLIGITAYVVPAHWDVWHTPATIIHQSFVDHVQRAGGTAVVLPPDGRDADMIDRLDGLLLTSGPDIAPSLYGASIHPNSDSPDPARDASELRALRRAFTTDLPVLGVCRGMQLIAVASGGTLHQHIPDMLGSDRHSEHSGTMSYHAVSLAPGSRVASILGDELNVNSHHHQAIADPGRLIATGWAHDGVIEAVEDPARPFVLGVQWHPEQESDGRLFAAFLSASARRRPPSAG